MLLTESNQPHVMKWSKGGVRITIHPSAEFALSPRLPNLLNPWGRSGLEHPKITAVPFASAVCVQP